MIINSPYISGSLTVTGNIIASGSITLSGSIASASYAANADLLDGLDATVFTLTSSFIAQTASFTAFTSSLNSFSASINSFSASILTYTSSLNNKTSSFATTGSNTFIGTQTISGSVLQSGSFTSTGTLTAQTLVIQTITSSVVYSSGSNIFGNDVSNSQTFTGSVNITGSLSLNSITIPTSASLASTYLQLAGGTLTGALYINYANPVLRFKGATLDGYIINSSDKLYIADYNTATKGMTVDLSTGALTQLGSGAVTLLGALGGTSATFTSTLLLNSASSPSAGFILFNYASNASSRSWKVSNDQVDWGDFAIQQSTTQTGSTYATKLLINATGAATFSSSVTATQGIFSQPMTNGSTSAFTDPNLALKATVSTDTTGFIGMTFATSDAPNYGYSYGALRDSGGVGDLVWRNHFNSVQGTELMRLRFNGTLGIGTASPSTLLQAYSTAVATQISIDGTGRYKYFETYASGTRKFRVGWDNTSVQAEVWADANAPIVFATNDIEKMRITSGGNVGIGTSTPTAIGNYNALTISGTDGSFIDLRYNNTDSGRIFTNSATSLGFECLGTNPIKFSTNSGSGATERMRIIGTGEVLIGITTTSLANSGTQFVPNGEIYNSIINSLNTLHVYDRTNAAYRFYVGGNGGISNYQANNINLSDERTKKDVIPLESYWDKFKAIEIVKFKYKDQTHDDFNIGVIAQQVEEIAPEFVDIDGFGETPEDGIPYKTIYTTDLYHATIKVLQEAMAKIETLEATNDDLQSQINELKAQ